MRSRLAQIHQRDDDGQLAPIDLELPQAPEFNMVGGGLYYTVGDYLKFVKMKLNQGTANGRQLLQPEEDTTIKHQGGPCMSDLFGKSGRRMLKALCAGERGAKKLAALEMGTLRLKLPRLELVLTGQFTEYHGRLIAGELELMELLERQIAEFDEQNREVLAAYVQANLPAARV